MHGFYLLTWTVTLNRDPVDPSDHEPTWLWICCPETLVTKWRWPTSRWKKKQAAWRWTGNLWLREIEVVMRKENCHVYQGTLNTESPFHPHCCALIQEHHTSPSSPHHFTIHILIPSTCCHLAVTLLSFHHPHRTVTSVFIVHISPSSFFTYIFSVILLTLWFLYLMVPLSSIYPYFYLYIPLSSRDPHLFFLGSPCYDFGGLTPNPLQSLKSFVRYC